MSKPGNGYTYLKFQTWKVKEGIADLVPDHLQLHSGCYLELHEILSFSKKDRLIDRMHSNLLTYPTISIIWGVTTNKYTFLLGPQLILMQAKKTTMFIHLKVHLIQVNFWH